MNADSTLFSCFQVHRLASVSTDQTKEIEELKASRQQHVFDGGGGQGLRVRGHLSRSDIGQAAGGLRQQLGRQPVGGRGRVLDGRGAGEEEPHPYTLPLRGPRRAQGRDEVEVDAAHGRVSVVVNTQATKIDLASLQGFPDC